MIQDFYNKKLVQLAKILKLRFFFTLTFVFRYNPINEALCVSLMYCNLVNVFMLFIVTCKYRKICNSLIAMNSSFPTCLNIRVTTLDSLYYLTTEQHLTYQRHQDNVTRKRLILEVR